ncbi:FtsX-like permease family protein [Eggerthellaceae bacterium 24-137]
MEPLRTLVKAGLRAEKGTFIGLAILLFLSALALTFTINLFVDLSEREGVLLDEAGSGDMFAQDLPQKLNDEAIAEITALPEVQEVQVAEGFSASTRYENAEGRELREATLSSSNIYEAWGTSLDFNVVSNDFQGYVNDEAGPGPGEAYVRTACKTLFGLDVGDYLVMSFGDREERLRVAGFFEDPQWGSPFFETARALISKADFERLLALAEASAKEAGADGEDTSIVSMGSTPYPIAEINVLLTPDARAQGITGVDLVRIVAEETAWGAGADTLSARETYTGYMLMVVQVMSAIFGAFSLLLFVVALVLCIHTASAAIESGYANWGIMKAVGLPRKTLRRALFLQYALCALVSLAAGFLAGCLSAPALWPSFLLITGILVQNPSFPAASLVCCGALLATLCLCVLAKARKIGRISPLAAMRQGKDDIRFAPRGASGIGGSCLAASLAWRAIVSKKGRYLGLGACSLLLCAFIALCFGIGGAVEDDDSVYQTFGVWKSDASVAFEEENVELDDVLAAVEEATPVARVWQESATLLNVNGGAHTFVGLSDIDVINDASMIAGRKPIHNNEVLAGLNFARSMGLDVGDEFVVTGQDGAERRLMVSGVLSTILNGGDGIVMTYDGVKDLAGLRLAGGDGSWQIQLANPDKAAEAVEAVNARFGEKVDTEDTGLFGTSTDMLLLIRSMFTMIGYGMAAFAVVMACVAVMLVSRRMLISEQRDLGVYRALGFSVRSLRASFSLRFLAVALAGALVGAALAMLFGSNITGALFGLFGVGSFSIQLPWWKAVAIGAAFALVFALAAYGFSRSIRHVSIQELVAE